MGSSLRSPKEFLSSNSGPHNDPPPRRELETDIMKYKQEGTVMVAGDLNSRIGEEGDIERKNIDKEVNENGREWLSLSRATGLMTMTGIREEADFTCYNYNDQGNSVVDHICIEEGNSSLVEQIEYKRD